MKGWKIQYQHWEPDKQPLRESLCTLGNGYFATRGAFEMMEAGSPHYPGTYLAGGYNRLESEVQGKIIENEDLVNWPNWLRLDFKIEDSEWFRVEDPWVESLEQEFDMEKGLLTWNIIFNDPKGHRTEIQAERITSLSDPHLAGIRWTVTPLDWSGACTIRSTLDGTVTNKGVERYKDLNGQHLIPEKATKIGEDGIQLSVLTNTSRIRMSQAARTLVIQKGKPVPVERKTEQKTGRIAQEIEMKAMEEHPFQVEKLVAIYTSRDFAIMEPEHEARKKIFRTSSFDALQKDHHFALKGLWERCKLTISGENKNQTLLRFHTFHLLQTLWADKIQVDAGIPARGLHGEAYRGHIFWDELFILPYLNFRIPERARQFLMYRYRRLSEAKYAAWEAGYKGAMFPWQSGSNGREETQRIHLNPLSGRWLPDNTHMQRHINSAIAYNIWHYFQVTQDLAFLSSYGAEMILEIARFWGSMATYDEERGQYVIEGVVGPDEYHTHYPGSDSPGLKNNAYTNVMAVWVFKTVLEILELLGKEKEQELLNMIGIDQETLLRWDSLSRHMFIPFHETDIISQFEGYEQLKDIDLEPYKKKYGEDLRLDRILEKENDSPVHYKASKQADALMLFFLFSTEELQDLFSRCGYELAPEMIPKNIAYYEQRTTHGSTLSRIIYSWARARSDRNRSWRDLQKALVSDFEDVQGGTTSEGIHLGAMAGTLDLIQRCYTGLEIRDDVIWFNPTLPGNLNHIEFTLQYRGHWINFHLEVDHFKLSFQETKRAKVFVGHNGEVVKMGSGEELVFKLGEKVGK